MEWTAPRVNPNLNYGLWVTMMCQCRYIHCKKYTTVVGEIDCEGSYAYVGVEICEKSLYFPFNFTVILNLL